MSCSATSSFKYSFLKNITSFTERQLKAIHNDFTKYSNSKQDSLSLEEFRSFVGLLGKTRNLFICKRIMITINKMNQTESLGSNSITFEGYVKFLNLVNNGTIDDKIKYTFHFFDLLDNSLVTKEDFVKVYFEICQFLSILTNTKCMVTKENIENLFNDLLEKYCSGQRISFLNLEYFTVIFGNINNEDIDLFNIFHNILHNNSKVNIDKDQQRQLCQIEQKIKGLYDKLTFAKVNKELVLTNKKYIISKDEAQYNINRINSIYKKNYKQMKTKPEDRSSCFINDFLKSNSNSNSNSNKQEKNKENDLNTRKISGFHLNIDKNHSQFSKIIPNHIIKYINSEIQDDHEELNDDEYEEDESESSEEKDEKEGTTIETYDKYDTNDINRSKEKEKNTYEIFNLNEIRLDKYHMEKLLEDNLDPKENLVIINKDKFIKEIQGIYYEIRDLNKKIHGNKKEGKRRKGISINLDYDNDIENEDFFNSYIANKSEEKGLIHFGNSNINLVLNMMMGIKATINSLNESSQVKEQFEEEMLFSTDNEKIFHEVNKFSYSLGTNDAYIPYDLCEFTDYSPKIFDNIRKLYGINNNNYLKSLGPENFLGNLILTNNRSLKELVSTGKSGSFFYFSYDSKYLLKTISKNEYDFFRSILKEYYIYIYNNPNTLLQRYYGLHSLEYKGNPLYLVVMNNFFNTGLEIQYKYDLKGSSYQRQSRLIDDKDYKKYDFSIPLKDNDLIDRKESFSLSKNEYSLLMKQIELDSSFLEKSNINDYSLIIGVHNIDDDQKNKKVIRNKLLHETTIRGTMNTVGRKPFYETYSNGLLLNDDSKIVYLGIIDILTEYKGNKKVEHAFKSVFQGKGISCQPPSLYSKRFIEFMKNIFKVE